MSGVATPQDRPRDRGRWVVVDFSCPPFRAQLQFGNAWGRTRGSFVLEGAMKPSQWLIRLALSVGSIFVCFALGAPSAHAQG